jgi:hypothetical protein
MDDEERREFIENMTTEQKELLEKCKEFWMTKAGKDSIKNARIKERDRDWTKEHKIGEINEFQRV